MRRAASLAVALLGLCAAPLLAADPPRVIAVSGPLAYFASAIAGDKAEVVYPVPEGQDPMLWRPAIAEIAEIQSADLILLNGAGFADWTTKASLPRARTVLTSRALEGAFIEAATAVTHSHGGEGAHSHSGAVPQTWLDFAQAATQAEAVASGLKRSLPGGEIQAGLVALKADLDALDARAKDVGAALQGRTLIASGPGLAYFARAYGLDLRELAWVPGAPLDPAALSAAMEGTENPAFIWMAAPDAAAEAAVGAMAQVRFDTGADDPADFLALMNANLDALAGLGGS
ncbi:metal ABC transporter substrate-binding protein [Oceanibium sediminis]|uniref:metal ABC transporter substrate-binding protein n=1 Tax=Oceanibium sediminis TaxID=2026339 RepID=UPI000DD3ACB7|nr:metal ABC transporter substrate-binding protein [Oceanibium sediminis]